MRISDWSSDVCSSDLNIIMIPLGIIMIRLVSRVVGAPRSAVMPVIMVFCAVGAFATAGNNLFAVYCVAAFGLLGFVMEKKGYPVRSEERRVGKECVSTFRSGG